ncbi:MAG: hypothetical protein KDB21_02995 [Acidimicrobiales bacterium]|nr:hypothetical protein [Acidimicrobiales bacterium]
MSDTTSDWLEPVVAALDERQAPVRVFFRDDDAGWDDPALFALLDCFDDAGVVIDLAVIPTALGPALAQELVARWRGGGVRLHQHGYSHTNHELEGRKCEFGGSRPVHQLAIDIADGWSRLQRLLGECVDPAFTPPWNRCVPELGPVLAEHGFRVLSRDTTAPEIGHPRLVEQPVTVDWLGRTRGTRWDRAELGHRLAASLAERDTIGVMLHHAVTDDAERSAIGEFVAVVAAHPMAQCCSLMEAATLAEPASPHSHVGT